MDASVFDALIREILRLLDRRSDIAYRVSVFERNCVLFALFRLLEIFDAYRNLTKILEEAVYFGAVDVDTRPPLLDVLDFVENRRNLLIKITHVLLF